MVETTILTDYLLKKDQNHANAAQLIAKYSSVSVHQFAWKEFKRGPLHNFVWSHNTIVEEGSLAAFNIRLVKLSASPRRYLLATALQALHTAVTSELPNLPAQPTAGTLSAADVATDMARVNLRAIITKAWRSRTTLFGGAKASLPCYPDAQIKYNSAKRIIDDRPRDCPKGVECCLKARWSGRLPDVKTVRAAIIADPGRKEVTERRKVLRTLYTHTSVAIDKKACRSIGDAYFVLASDPDESILTTNIRDIEPMAIALNRRIDRP